MQNKLTSRDMCTFVCVCAQILVCMSYGRGKVERRGFVFLFRNLNIVQDYLLIQRMFTACPYCITHCPQPYYITMVSIYGLVL